VQFRLQNGLAQRRVRPGVVARPTSRGAMTKVVPMTCTGDSHGQCDWPDSSRLMGSCARHGRATRRVARPAGAQLAALDATLEQARSQGARFLPLRDAAEESVSRVGSRRALLAATNRAEAERSERVGWRWGAEGFGNPLRVPISIENSVIVAPGLGSGLAHGQAQTIPLHEAAPARNAPLRPRPWTQKVRPIEHPIACG